MRCTRTWRTVIASTSPFSFDISILLVGLVSWSRGMLANLFLFHCGRRTSQDVVQTMLPQVSRPPGTIPQHHQGSSPSSRSTKRSCQSHDGQQASMLTSYITSLRACVIMPASSPGPPGRGEARRRLQVLGETYENIPEYRRIFRSDEGPR